MKENKFLDTIQSIIHSDFIGDDCAYIKEKDLIITQDTLVEDVHFRTEWLTPYQLGRKSISVNLSDIAAAAGIPQYAMVSISLPSHYNEEFIDKFYNGLNDVCKEFKTQIIGGDITGSEKIVITITLIGYGMGTKISKRSNAKIGDLIVTTGYHGSSAAGLWLLENPSTQLNYKIKAKLFTAHVNPYPQIQTGRMIAEATNEKLCMMDTSDGLADALFKIAKMSNVGIEINFSSIPYDKSIEDVAKLAEKDFIDWIFYGGEDYQLIAAIAPQDYDKIKNPQLTIIGKVVEGSQVEVKIEQNIITIDQNSINKAGFNHFKEQC